MRKRITAKMPVKACFVVGCGIEFTGTDDADANTKVQEHVIRTHEANGAEERKVYLATHQATLVDGYMQKLREAKNLGIDTDQFIRLTGMQNGGLAGISENKSSKMEIPEWVKDQSFE